MQVPKHPLPPFTWHAADAHQYKVLTRNASVRVLSSAATYGALPPIRRFPGAGGELAFCVTMTDLPARVRVAVRSPPVFVVTEYGTLPEPLRMAPDIVIHVGTPVAVHEHPGVVVTVKVPVAAADDRVRLAGVTV